MSYVIANGYSFVSGLGYNGQPYNSSYTKGNAANRFGTDGEVLDDTGSHAILKKTKNPQPIRLWAVLKTTACCGL